MKRNYFLGLVIASLIALFLIFYELWHEIDTPATKIPLINPPTAPYQYYISGVGIVEPSSQSISIGTPLNRIVDKVLVKVGAKVKKGDILFSLEDADLKANLLLQETAYKSALARLNKLEALPRSEDLAEAKASLDIAKVELDLAKEQFDMVQNLPDPRALSREEINRRQFNYNLAEVKWQQAQAIYNKVKEGTWKPDLEIARLEAMQARANVHVVDAEIQRTIIQSPVDGTVLQIKINEGELPTPDTFRTPIMIIGNIEEKYLRVSINQLDIPHFHAKCPATAYFRGDASIEFPLEFVRIEPFLVDKLNLTNEISEKVDTRVLQIIYKIKDRSDLIYVGQQMDVFIKSPPEAHQPAVEK